LRDCLVKEAIGGRHLQERGHFRRAARLPEDRDIVRVATECCHVVADPPQCRDHVQHARVARVGKPLIATR
jgi:hypothetical protein